MPVLDDRDTRDRLSLLAAALLNSRPIGTIGSAQREPLAADFLQLARELLSGAPSAVSAPSMRRGNEEVAADLALLQQRLVAVVPRLLPEARFAAFTGKCLKVPIGADESLLPVALRVRVSWKGGQQITQIMSGEPDSLVSAMMLSLFMADGRAPLGACRSCRRVIAVRSRGRRATYCSDACKALGIPSRVRRYEYVKRYRHRLRQRDIEEARHATARLNKSVRYAALKKAFPFKPRKALLWLARELDRGAARTDR
jgi:hypothetical protein